MPSKMPRGLVAIFVALISTSTLWAQKPQPVTRNRTASQRVPEWSDGATKKKVARKPKRTTSGDSKNTSQPLAIVASNRYGPIRSADDPGTRGGCSHGTCGPW